MFHAEALFLVDDDEAEVLEFDLWVEQLVGADDDVDAAVGQAFQRFFGFLGVLEAREGLDGDRKAFVALREGIDVLLDEQGRWCEDGHLFAVLDSFEGGAHGDFRLAEANVARQETIHGNGFLHVGFDFVDGAQLVWRFLVRESVL